MKNPEAIWVMRARDAVAAAAFEAAGVEPVIVAPDKATYGVGAADCRDSDFLLLCTMVVMFHDGKYTAIERIIKIPDYRCRARRHVVTRGVQPKKHRKGRKPVGV